MQVHSKVAHLRIPERSAAASLEAQVRAHLEQLLASPLFDASARSRDFLCFVVDETLAGRGATINQTAIAIGVFGRRPDFDPVLDPIVRVQAGRLRRSLERYYLLRNADPIRIELQKGSYTPVFIANHSPPPIQITAAPAETVEWPLVVIHAFEGHSLIDQQMAAHIADELTLELHRYGDIRVAREHDVGLYDNRFHHSLRFELGGKVRVEGDDVYVTSQVIDRSSGEDLWRDSFHATGHAHSMPRGVDDLARIIAACVGSDHGVIVRTLVSELRKRVPTADASYSTILRSYHRSFLSQRDDLITTLEAVQRLAEREPERALIWTHLARLYLQNYSYQLSDVRTPIEKCISAGYRALHADPTCGRARCIVAEALLVKDDTQAAMHELRKMLHIMGDSLAHREVVGSLLSLCGDWETGLPIVRDAIERNPFCSPLANQALWAHHMLREEFEQAYRAALAYQDSSGFWREVMLACSLAHFGHVDDARANIIEILCVWPDFLSRSDELIGYYIKSPSLRELIGRSLHALSSSAH
jgi:adenylate cyclase